MRWALAMVGAVVCITGSAAVANAQCPAQTVWPGTQWADGSAAANRDAVAALEAYAFKLEGTIEQRIGVRTDGVVIIKGGALVYEKYARGFGPDNPHLTWSVSKSTVNAMVGMGVRLGILDVDASICTYRSFHTSDICKLTLRDLLMWGSGLYWAETYENDSPRASSVAAMLYGEGSEDMAEFVAGQGFELEPGQRYNYSSGDTTMLTSVVHAAMAHELGARWMFTDLFDVIGARSSVFELDAAGTPVGSSYWYATPRDMARFGYLYLNDGCWNGRRMLPQGWVAQSTTVVNSAFLSGQLGFEQGDTVPGLHWWLNQPVNAIADVPMPDVPSDTFAAEGHWGQFIWVVPSRNVVIVRTGDDRDGTFDVNRFVALALEVAQ